MGNSTKPVVSRPFGRANVKAGGQEAAQPAPNPAKLPVSILLGTSVFGASLLSIGYANGWVQGEIMGAVLTFGPVIEMFSPGFILGLQDGAERAHQVLLKVGLVVVVIAIAAGAYIVHQARLANRAYERAAASAPAQPTDVWRKRSSSREDVEKGYLEWQRAGQRGVETQPSK